MRHSDPLSEKGKPASGMADGPRPLGRGSSPRGANHRGKVSAEHPSNSRRAPSFRLENDAATRATRLSGFRPRNQQFADDVPKRAQARTIAERSQQWLEEQSRHQAQSEPRNFRTAPRKAEVSERRDTRVPAAPASSNRSAPRVRNCNDGLGRNDGTPVAPVLDAAFTTGCAWRFCLRPSGFTIGRRARPKLPA
jgi:hypothetical protein